MDIIRQTTVGPHRVSLEAIDRYNDYSVIYDHVVRVENGDTGERRRFDAGTGEGLALRAYDRAVWFLRGAEDIKREASR